MMVAFWSQPPSGGCVLKPEMLETAQLLKTAATFGWLCVETKPLKQFKIQTPSSHLRVAVC